ncbi:HIT family protein [Candidatus Shapirobacteria bacterium]|nr:HIT family protein [Candidatus Shapirobacteria bacterium]
MTDKAWCFCDRESYKDRIFRESGDFYCLFDDAPVSPGHALIAPKKHIVSILELDQETWNKLYVEIVETIKIIEKTDLKKLYQEMLDGKMYDNIEWFLKKSCNHPRINTKPDGYNHGVNDGRAAGRTTDHLHWHVIPRYDGDVNDPKGGVRFVIPEMGNYKIAR